jgi:hypothetical protein
MFIRYLEAVFFPALHLIFRIKRATLSLLFLMGGDEPD